MTLVDINQYLDYIWTVIKLLSLPAIVRAYVFFQSLRMYGVYTLYKNRSEIVKHDIFTMLDLLYTDEELFNRISDNARREIFKDIFKIEIYGLNEISLSFIDFIYARKSFLEFMKYHRYLDCTELVEFFLRIYNAHRDKMERKIYHKLIRSGLDKKKSVYVIQKYYEFTAQNSDILRTNIESLKTRGNLYFSVFDILNGIRTYLLSEKKFLPEKFMTLNGKLNGVVYKSYVSFNDSQNKIRTVDNDIQ